MIDNVIECLKSSYVLPKVLISSYKKLNLSEKELIVLIYLINQKDLEYNPQKFSKELDYNLNDILTIINDLSSKDVLKIEHKLEKNIHKEIIDLNPLYNKLGFIILDDEKKGKNTLFDKFEKELGRTLSPMEYEIINAWHDNYSEEIIIEALKEAIYNNATNLRYIDKILSEWNKKGIKTLEDIENNRKAFLNNKKEKKELYEYDWLNEN